MPEQITECGTVISKNKNILEVSLEESLNCTDCSAKIFCKSQNNNKKIVLVKDTIGCNPGDSIEFSIKGSNLIKVSFILYGIPLILILSGIICCNYIFSGNTSKELYSISVSILSVIIYFIILFIFLKYKGKPVDNMPVTVHRY